MSTRTALGRCAVLALLAALALPASAAAQRFKWWQADRIQSELGMTKEQSTRLEEIFQSYLPALRKQKDALDLVERDFNRLVAKGDYAATIAQVDVVEQARAALNKSRSLQLVHMRRVLTADQHAKLTALFRQRDQERDRSRNR